MKIRLLIITAFVLLICSFVLPRQNRIRNSIDVRARIDKIENVHFFRNYYNKRFFISFYHNNQKYSSSIKIGSRIGLIDESFDLIVKVDTINYKPIKIVAKINNNPPANTIRSYQVRAGIDSIIRPGHNNVYTK